MDNVFGAHFAGATQIVTLAYGALVTVPVVLGLRFGVRTTIVLYVFEVLVLVVVGVAVLARGGHDGLSLTPFTWPHGAGAKDIFVSFSLAVLAFGGFEASAPLAEETRNPRRNVPIAVLGSVIISGLLYVFGSYVMVIAFGSGHADKFASDSNPFHTATVAFIGFLAPVITWVFLSSVTSSYVAANTQTSRVIFAGARGGLWPKGLGFVTRRLRTPWAAAVAFVVPSVLIGVVSTAFTDPATASGFLGTYGILGLVIMYVVANLALIVQWVKLRRGGVRKSLLLWVVVPVVGLAVLAVPVWGDLRPGQAAPYNALPWLTVALVAVGVGYAVVLGVVRPRVLADAPALLEGGDTPV